MQESEAKKRRLFDHGFREWHESQSVGRDSSRRGKGGPRTCDYLLQARHRDLLVRLPPACHRQFLSVSVQTSKRSAGEWSFNITSSINVSIDLPLIMLSSSANTPTCVSNGTELMTYVLRDSLMLPS